MPVETLYAQDPTVINATYDRIWISEIVLTAPSPIEDATARVCLKKFRFVDGQPEFLPNHSEWLTIEGLFSGKGEDQELSNAIDHLMLYIAKVGAGNGVIAPAARK